MNYLTKSGIEYVGGGRNEGEIYGGKVTEVKGIRIGLVAYTYSNDKNLAGLNVEKMKMAVKKTLGMADMVIVMMHAGVEYQPIAGQQQVDFARAAIDAGAEMVIGHHPHVVQNEEVYKGKYIFYSLGNFVFDQMWSEATRKGLALKISLGKDGVKNIERVPVMIDDYCQPRIISSSK